MACEELPKYNHQTSAKLFNDAMSVLWPGGVKHEQVFLLLTDAAPYMVKAADALKVLYIKMIHVTCLAHGVNRLAECIRFQFKNVDSLVSKVKKIFLKAPSRISKFKELYPEMPLPPEPVLTRWGTWLTAVEYYAKYFNEIKAIISQLDDDSASILASKELLVDETLGNDLVYIKSNYCFLSHKIQALENPSTSLNQNLKIIEEIENKVSEAEGPVADMTKQKLKFVLDKNKGFNTLKKINKILCGRFEGNIDMAYTITELSMFKYAPITSCDVERSFSRYKAIFRPNRQSFNFDHLKKHVIVNCNQFDKASVMEVE